MNDIYGGGKPVHIDVPINPVSVAHDAEQRREAVGRESQFTPHVGRWTRFVTRLKNR